MCLCLIEIMFFEFAACPYESLDVPACSCLDGCGACPPEDVGGIHSYQEMLEVLKKPRHPERASYIKWLGLVAGEKWDARFCSVRELNKRLVMLAK
jgi:hypothetical protein